MKTLKNFNKKYFICSGNDDTIYKKINSDEFKSYYDDYVGLIINHSKYFFKTYPSIKYQYISINEYQSIMNNSYKVIDLWEKYFGY